ncbi:MAG: N-acetylmuramoyl-L-alanine amidase [Candidatus Omnitrophica bacterium]|nr:N-acetylmuramoyl-L-alanine amidase [Candidatus Omnitrophota bacterium]
MGIFNTDATLLQVGLNNYGELKFYDLGAFTEGVTRHDPMAVRLLHDKNIEYIEKSVALMGENEASREVADYFKQRADETFNAENFSALWKEDLSKDSYDRFVSKEQPLRRAVEPVSLTVIPQQAVQAAREERDLYRIEEQTTTTITADMSGLNAEYKPVIYSVVSSYNVQAAMDSDIVKIDGIKVLPRDIISKRRVSTETVQSNNGQKTVLYVPEDATPGEVSEFLKGQKSADQEKLEKYAFAKEFKMASDFLKKLSGKEETPQTQSFESLFPEAQVDASARYDFRDDFRNDLKPAAIGDASMLSFSEKKKLFNRYTGTIDTNTGLVFATFEPDINARVLEVARDISGNRQMDMEQAWDLLNTDKDFAAKMDNDSFIRDITDDNYSSMFRYPELYDAILTKLIDSAVAKIEASENTPQEISIGIVGSAYGQEPNTVAILAKRKAEQELARIGQPKDAIKIKINVIGKPGKTHYRLLNNRIIYTPESLSTVGATVEEMTSPASNLIEGELERYFTPTTNGNYVRSAELNSMMQFNAIDLVDQTTHNIGIPKVDMLLVHNVIQHLDTPFMDLNTNKTVPRAEQGASKAVKEAATIAFDLLDSMVKPNGIISIIAESNDVHPEISNAERSSITNNTAAYTEAADVQAIAPIAHVYVKKAFDQRADSAVLGNQYEMPRYQVDEALRTVGHSQAPKEKIRKAFSDLVNARLSSDNDFDARQYPIETQRMAKVINRASEEISSLMVFAGDAATQDIIDLSSRASAEMVVPMLSIAADNYRDVTRRIVALDDGYQGETEDLSVRMNALKMLAEAHDYSFLGELKNEAFRSRGWNASETRTSAVFTVETTEEVYEVKHYVDSLGIKSSQITIYYGEMVEEEVVKIVFPEVSKVQPIDAKTVQTAGAAIEAVFADMTQLRMSVRDGKVTLEFNGEEISAKVYSAEQKAAVMQAAVAVMESNAGDAQLANAAPEMPARPEAVLPEQQEKESAVGSVVAASGMTATLLVKLRLIKVDGNPLEEKDMPAYILNNKEFVREESGNKVYTIAGVKGFEIFIRGDVAFDSSLALEIISKPEGATVAWVGKDVAILSIDNSIGNRLMLEETLAKKVDMAIKFKLDKNGVVTLGVEGVISFDDLKAKAAALKAEEKMKGKPVYVADAKDKKIYEVSESGALNAVAAPEKGILLLVEHKTAANKWSENLVGQLSLPGEKPVVDYAVYQDEPVKMIPVFKDGAGNTVLTKVLESLKTSREADRAFAKDLDVNALEGVNRTQTREGYDQGLDQAIRTESTAAVANTNPAAVRSTRVQKLEELAQQREEQRAKLEANRPITAKTGLAPPIEGKEESNVIRPQFTRTITPTATRPVALPKAGIITEKDVAMLSDPTTKGLQYFVKAAAVASDTSKLESTPLTRDDFRASLKILEAKLKELSDQGYQSISITTKDQIIDSVVAAYSDVSQVFDIMKGEYPKDKLRLDDPDQFVHSVLSAMKMTQEEDALAIFEKVGKGKTFAEYAATLAFLRWHSVQRLGEGGIVEVIVPSEANIDGYKNDVPVMIVFGLMSNMARFTRTTEFVGGQELRVGQEDIDFLQSQKREESPYVIRVSEMRKFINRGGEVKNEGKSFSMPEDGDRKIIAAIADDIQVALDGQEQIKGQGDIYSSLTSRLIEGAADPTADFITATLEKVLTLKAKLAAQGQKDLLVNTKISSGSEAEDRLEVAFSPAYNREFKEIYEELNKELDYIPESYRTFENFRPVLNALAKTFWLIEGKDFQKTDFYKKTEESPSSLEEYIEYGRLKAKIRNNDFVTEQEMFMTAKRVRELESQGMAGTLYDIYGSDRVALLRTVFGDKLLASFVTALIAKQHIADPSKDFNEQDAKRFIANAYFSRKDKSINMIEAIELFGRGKFVYMSATPDIIEQPIRNLGAKTVVLSKEDPLSPRDKHFETIVVDSRDEQSARVVSEAAKGFRASMARGDRAGYLILGPDSDLEATYEALSAELGPDIVKYVSGHDPEQNVQDKKLYMGRLENGESLIVLVAGDVTGLNPGARKTEGPSLDSLNVIITDLQTETRWQQELGRAPDNANRVGAAKGTRHQIILSLEDNRFLFDEKTDLEKKADRQRAVAAIQSAASLGANIRYRIFGQIQNVTYYNTTRETLGAVLDEIRGIADTYYDATAIKQRLTKSGKIKPAQADQVVAEVERRGFVQEGLLTREGNAILDLYEHISTIDPKDQKTLIEAFVPAESEKNIFTLALILQTKTDARVRDVDTLVTLAKQELNIELDKLREDLRKVRMSTTAEPRLDLIISKLEEANQDGKHDGLIQQFSKTRDAAEELREVERKAQKQYGEFQKAVTRKHQDDTTVRIKNGENIPQTSWWESKVTDIKDGLLKAKLNKKISKSSNDLNQYINAPIGEVQAELGGDHIDVLQAFKAAGINSEVNKIKDFARARYTLGFIESVAPEWFKKQTISTVAFMANNPKAITSLIDADTLEDEIDTEEPAYKALIALAEAANGGLIVSRKQVEQLRDRLRVDSEYKDTVNSLTKILGETFLFRKWILTGKTKTPAFRFKDVIGIVGNKFAAELKPETLLKGRGITKAIAANESIKDNPEVQDLALRLATNRLDLSPIDFARLQGRIVKALEGLEQLDVELEMAMDNVDKLELLADKYVTHKTVNPEALDDDAYRKYKEEDLVWTRTSDFGQNDQILEDALASLEAENINEQVRLRRLQVQRSQKFNGVAVTAQGRDVEADILRLQRTAEKLKGIKENLATFNGIVIGSQQNRSSLMPIVDEENVLYVDPIVFDDNDSLEFLMRWAATTGSEQENPEKAAKLANLVSENSASTVIPELNALAQTVKQDGDKLSDQAAKQALDIISDVAIEEDSAAEAIKGVKESFDGLKQIAADQKAKVEQAKAEKEAAEKTKAEKAQKQDNDDKDDGDDQGGTSASSDETSAKQSDDAVETAKIGPSWLVKAKDTTISIIKKMDGQWKKMLMIIVILFVTFSTNVSSYAQTIFPPSKQQEAVVSVQSDINRPELGEKLGLIEKPALIEPLKGEKLSETAELPQYKEKPIWGQDPQALQDIQLKPLDPMYQDITPIDINIMPIQPLPTIFIIGKAPANEQSGEKAPLEDTKAPFGMVQPFASSTIMLSLLDGPDGGGSGDGDSGTSGKTKTEESRPAPVKRGAMHEYIRQLAQNAQAVKTDHQGSKQDLARKNNRSIQIASNTKQRGETSGLSPNSSRLPRILAMRQAVQTLVERGVANVVNIVDVVLGVSEASAEPVQNVNVEQFSGASLIQESTKTSGDVSGSNGTGNSISNVGNVANAANEVNVAKAENTGSGNRNSGSKEVPAVLGVLPEVTGNTMRFAGVTVANQFYRGFVALLLMIVARIVEVVLKQIGYVRSGRRNRERRATARVTTAGPEDVDAGSDHEAFGQISSSDDVIVAETKVVEVRRNEARRTVEGVSSDDFGVTVVNTGATEVKEAQAVEVKLGFGSMPNAVPGVHVSENRAENVVVVSEAASVNAAEPRVQGDLGSGSVEESTRISSIDSNVVAGSIGYNVDEVDVSLDAEGASMVLEVSQGGNKNESIDADEVSKTVLGVRDAKVENRLVVESAVEGVSKPEELGTSGSSLVKEQARISSVGSEGSIGDKEAVEDVRLDAEGVSTVLEDCVSENENETIGAEDVSREVLEVRDAEVENKLVVRTAVEGVSKLEELGTSGSSLVREQARISSVGSEGSIGDNVVEVVAGLDAEGVSMVLEVCESEVENETIGAEDVSNTVLENREDGIKDIAFGASSGVSVSKEGVSSANNSEEVGQVANSILGVSEEVEVETAENKLVKFANSTISENEKGRVTPIAVNDEQLDYIDGKSLVSNTIQIDQTQVLGVSPEEEREKSGAKFFEFEKATQAVRKPRKDRGNSYISGDSVVLSISNNASGRGTAATLIVRAVSLLLVFFKGANAPNSNLNKFKSQIRSLVGGIRAFGARIIGQASLVKKQGGALWSASILNQTEQRSTSNTSLMSQTAAAQLPQLEKKGQEEQKSSLSPKMETSTGDMELTVPGSMKEELQSKSRLTEFLAQTVSHITQLTISVLSSINTILPRKALAAVAAIMLFANNAYAGTSEVFTPTTWPAWAVTAVILGILAVIGAIGVFVKTATRKNVVELTKTEKRAVKAIEPIAKAMVERRFPGTTWNEDKWNEQVEFAAWLARSAKDDIHLAELAGGKTIAYILAAEMIMRTNPGRKVMVFVTGHYFSSRDANQANEILSKLGRKVGYFAPANNDEKELTGYTFVDGQATAVSRESLYREANVIYTVVSQPVFDLLAEQFATDIRAQVQMNNQWAILADEIQVTLLKEAITPFIVTGSEIGDAEYVNGENVDAFVDRLNVILSDADAFAKAVIARNRRLIREFDTDDVARKVTLTARGKRALRAQIGKDANLEHWVQRVENALTVELYYNEDVDFFRKGTEAVLISRSGAALQGQRLSHGLHQAIDFKLGNATTTQRKVNNRTTLKGFADAGHIASIAGATRTLDEDDVKAVFGNRINARRFGTKSTHKDVVVKFFNNAESKMAAAVRSIVTKQAAGDAVIVEVDAVATRKDLVSKLEAAGVASNMIQWADAEDSSDAQAISAKIAKAGNIGMVTIVTSFAIQGIDPELSREARAQGKTFWVISTHASESSLDERQLLDRVGRRVGEKSGREAFWSLKDRIFVQNPGLASEAKAQLGSVFARIFPGRRARTILTPLRNRLAQQTRQSIEAAEEGQEDIQAAWNKFLNLWQATIKPGRIAYVSDTEWNKLTPKEQADTRAKLLNIFAAHASLFFSSIEESQQALDKFVHTYQAWNSQSPLHKRTEQRVNIKNAYDTLLARIADIASVEVFGKNNIKMPTVKESAERKAIRLMPAVVAVGSIAATVFTYINFFGAIKTAFISTISALSSIPAAWAIPVAIVAVFVIMIFNKNILPRIKAADKTAQEMDANIKGVNNEEHTTVLGAFLSTVKTAILSPAKTLLDLLSYTSMITTTGLMAVMMTKPALLTVNFVSDPTGLVVAAAIMGVVAVLARTLLSARNLSKIKYAPVDAHKGPKYSRFLNALMTGALGQIAVIAFYHITGAALTGGAWTIAVVAGYAAAAVIYVAERMISSILGDKGIDHKPAALGLAIAPAAVSGLVASLMNMSTMQAFSYAQLAQVIAPAGFVLMGLYFAVAVGKKVAGIAPIRAKGNRAKSVVRHALNVVYETVAASHMKVVFVTLSMLGITKLIGGISATFAAVANPLFWIAIGVGLVIYLGVITINAKVAKVALGTSAVLLSVGIANQAVASETLSANAQIERHAYYQKIAEQAAKEEDNVELRANILAAFNEVAEGRDPFVNQENKAKAIAQRLLSEDKGIAAAQARVGAKLTEQEINNIANAIVTDKLVNWFQYKAYRTISPELIKDVKYEDGLIRGVLDVDHVTSAIRTSIINSLIANVTDKDEGFKATAEVVLKNEALAQYIEEKGRDLDELRERMLVMYRRYLAISYMEEGVTVISAEEAAAVLTRAVADVVVGESISAEDEIVKGAAKAIVADEELAAFMAKTGMTEAKAIEAIVAAARPGLTSAYYTYVVNALLSGEKEALTSEKASRDSELIWAVISAAARSITTTDEEFVAVIKGLLEGKKAEAPVNVEVAPAVESVDVSNAPRAIVVPEEETKTALPTTDATLNNRQNVVWVNNEKAIQQWINLPRFAGKSPLTGKIITDAQYKTYRKTGVFVPAALIVAQFTQETQFLTDSNTKDMNNPANVGRWTNGTVTFEPTTLAQGIESYLNKIATTYLVNGKTVKDLIADGGFVNINGQRFADTRNYERELRVHVRNFKALAKTQVKEVFFVRWGHAGTTNNGAATKLANGETVTERELNKQIAEKLVATLRGQGETAIMVPAMPYESAPAWIHNEAKQYPGARYYPIEIHHDDVAKPVDNKIGIFLKDGDTAKKSKVRVFAQSIILGLALTFGNPAPAAAINSEKATDAGRLAVLHYEQYENGDAFSPVLIEAGFMDKRYISTIMSSDYQNRIVKGIIQGATKSYPTIVISSPVVASVKGQPSVISTVVSPKLEALERNDAIIPTVATHVKQTSQMVDYRERERKANMLVQYLSAAQYEKNTKAWIAAVTAREEILTSKTTVPVVEMIFTRRSQQAVWVDDGENRFDLNDVFSPKAYLVFKVNGKLTAMTPEGIVFDPSILEQAQEAHAKALEQLEAKSIEARSNVLSGAVLILTQDVEARGLSGLNEILKDLLINVSRFSETLRVNNGQTAETGRALTYLENVRAPFNYRLSYLFKDPIYMHEREAMFGERAAKVHYDIMSLFKTQADAGETVVEEEMPVFAQAAATVTEITDTRRGLVVTLSMVKRKRAWKILQLKLVNQF